MDGEADDEEDDDEMEVGEVLFLSDPGVPGPIFLSGCHSLSESCF